MLYGVIVKDDSGVLATWQRFGSSREHVIETTTEAARREFPTAQNLRVFADSSGSDAPVIAVDSVWLTDDGYIKVVAVRDGWAFVRPCTVNGYVRGKQPAIQTNLGWFKTWKDAATTLEP